MLNKYGRPLLGARSSRSSACRRRTTAAPCFEAAARRARLHEGRREHHSQPFMRWRDRFDVRDGGGASRPRRRPASARVTTSTSPRRRRADARARRVREGARLADHHARLPRRRARRAPDAQPNWCRGNGMLLHVHRATARGPRPAEGPRNQLPRARQVAAALRRRPSPFRHRRRQARGRSRCDARHPRPDAARTSFPPTRAAASTSTRTGPRCRPCLPAASGGIHVWHMPALVEIFGDDAILQFGGGSARSPAAAAAPAPREPGGARGLCPGAQRGPRPLDRRSRRSCEAAARSSRELAEALETWREIALRVRHRRHARQAM